jgi:hypothetical protein
MKQLFNDMLKFKAAKAPMTGTGFTGVIEIVNNQARRRE